MLQLQSKTDKEKKVKVISTGTHSLYTTYQDHEIMFHVSTMLPYTPNNQQQVCEGLGQAKDFREAVEGVTLVVNIRTLV